MKSFSSDKRRIYNLKRNGFLISLFVTIGYLFLLLALLFFMNKTITFKSLLTNKSLSFIFPIFLIIIVYNIVNNGKISNINDTIVFTDTTVTYTKNEVIHECCYASLYNVDYLKDKKGEIKSITFSFMTNSDKSGKSHIESETILNMNPMDEIADEFYRLLQKKKEE